GDRLIARFLDRLADRPRNLLHPLFCYVLAERHGHLLDARLADHTARRYRDLLDAFLGDELTSGHWNLLAHGVGNLLAHRRRHLLADDLRFVHRAAHVLDHCSRAAHCSFAPRAGALVQAAVDAHRLARDVVALDDRLVVASRDGFRHG